MSHSAQTAEIDDASPPESAVGRLLLERGKIDRVALERAERAQADSGERLDRVLTRLGLVGERDMAEALAEQLALPLAAAEDYPEAPLFEDALPVTFLKASQVLPIAGGEETVILAMADPLDDYAAQAVALRLGRPVCRCVAVFADLENALERLYAEGKSAIDQIVETTEQDGADSTDADVARLRDLASEAPVIRIVNLLIAKAVEARASDIHIEPYEAPLRVRVGRGPWQLWQNAPFAVRLDHPALIDVKVRLRLEGQPQRERVERGLVVQGVVELPGSL